MFSSTIKNFLSCLNGKMIISYSLLLPKPKNKNIYFVHIFCVICLPLKLFQVSWLIDRPKNLTQTILISVIKHFLNNKLPHFSSPLHSTVDSRSRPLFFHLTSLANKSCSHQHFSDFKSSGHRICLCTRYRNIYLVAESPFRGLIYASSSKFTFNERRR